MKKVKARNSTAQNEYWNLITSSLSSYEVKNISSNKKVTKRLVYNDYFLTNDIWDFNDLGKIPNFKDQFDNYKGYRGKITFETINPTIKLELKFVYYCKLFNDEWSISTVFNTYSSELKKLTQFLNEKHPRLTSLLDLDIDKTDKEWSWWLHKKGIKTSYKRAYIEGIYEHKAHVASQLRSLYESLVSFTDHREEWVKDKWDVRVLNKSYGISYNLSGSRYYIDFSKVKNNTFRQNFKNYIKTRLLSGRNFSFGTAINYSNTVPLFLNFLTDLEPEWHDLKCLTRQHIEKYLEYIRHYAKTSNKSTKPNPKRYIRHNLGCVLTFLQDLQRLESKIAPDKPSRQLLYPEDIPQLDKKSSDDIDHIPDYVLEQLFRSIGHLHPEAQPVVWVAFKTGLRISDVLGLTQDCLIRFNGKYSIQTDIEKVFVKGHKIPIDDHLANMIAALIHLSVERSNSDNNPHRYIFVRYRGYRKGKPFSRNWVHQHLNKLAIEKNIKDESGKIFHFKPHQFRHTYAVKMLNGGADILTVQDLLAHASPAMTMRYARLLDDTKRKEFEKVVAQGVFSFDLNGEIHQVAESKEVPEDIMDMLWKDEKLNAIDNPYGTCRARVNGNCPLASEPPCLTANDGKPCFDLQVGITSFDVKKYELHIESASKLIEVSKAYGRDDMVKANERNLERYQNIYKTIKDGNVIFGRSDRIKKKLERNNRKGAKNVKI